MDKVYIQKVIEGDLNSFRYLVDKYKDMAFSISFSILKNELTAEENVQDSFLRAFQKIESFKGKSKFSTWLYKIVVNEALPKTEKKSLRSVDIEDQNLPMDHSLIHNSMESLPNQDQKEYINKTLEKLNEKESLLLRLFYLNENNLEEIKEITNLSIANIKVTLHRARKNFYVLLKDELKHELNSIL